MTESDFVRLWVRLSPEAEQALVPALPCSPDAAESGTCVDVMTLVERLVEIDDMSGLSYGLTGRDVHDLLGDEPAETVPLGVLLRAADSESSELSGVTIDPIHVLLGILAFDSLLVTRELAWGGVTYERARRWTRRRFRPAR